METKLSKAPACSPSPICGRTVRSITSDHDVGASLDGAGYYAPADGVVKLVHSGSDMGTLIVVQHHLGNKATVNGVYMHGGDTVFVKAGERVTCGSVARHHGHELQH